MKKPLPSSAFLHECFSYNSETGDLVFKERPPSHFEGKSKDAAIIAKLRNARKSGKKATPNKTGYVQVSIDQIGYRGHRIIWKMVYGHDPIGIDHINGSKSDNRLVNLREADQSLNARNSAMKSNNTSGYTGVHYDKSRKKWGASIWFNGSFKSLGRFASKEDAITARKAGIEGLGFTERHGKQL